MLRFVTVNWRDYEGRGTEYVNSVHDMVRRNLPEGFEGAFEVFTDDPDPKGLSEGITLRMLPAGLHGWWNKLYLFSPDVFPAGDRIIFLDLDVLITGRLDEIAAYNGPFAILRDFYRPDGLGSAVMAWEAGRLDFIWRAYEAHGRPADIDGGDQAFIEVVTRRNGQYVVQASPVIPVEILQDKFPDAFVSYKLIAGPPAKASVVAFHGFPRPHDIETGWVPEIRKIGGMTRADLDMICNTAKEKLAANIRDAIERDLPWFDTAPEHDGHVCIVGGGPSLAETLPELKWRQSIGQKVWALNGCGKFLMRNGITPDAVIIADARPENVDFLQGLSVLSKETTLYLASQCHPSLFDHAEDYELNVILWHCNTAGMDDLLGEEKARPVHLIGGGSTVGMNAMVMAFAGGCRKEHLYGFDSSYRNGAHHTYKQAQNDGDRIIDALYRDQKFKISAWMAQQVNDFQNLAPELVADGCVITVAGDGLLPSVAADMVDDVERAA